MIHLIDFVPWWAWALLAAVIGYGVFRIFGLRTALAYAVAAAALILAKGLRQGGKDDAKREARVDDLERANEIRSDVAEADRRVNADVRDNGVRSPDANCRDC